jgi:ribosomal protein S18 acetylase RimI-like enzyme
LVLSKESGLVRDDNYSISLYEKNSLRALLDQAGFQEIRIHKNFSANMLKGDCGFMNNRMIAAFVKG